MINAKVLPVYNELNGAASSKIGEAMLTLNGNGPPTSGAGGTGAGTFLPFYYDATNNVWYFNTGTANVPQWRGVQLSDPV